MINTRTPLLFLTAAAGLCACTRAGTPTTTGVPPKPRAITAQELAGHLNFLSSDLLEGRAVGTRGIALAAAYHESVFKSLGLAPAFSGSYRQPFQLAGSRPDGKASLVLTTKGKRFAPKLHDDFVLGSFRKDAPALVAGELVYVGYGIQAKGRKWDDFKGHDVKGKVLLVEVNEPGNQPGGIFDGTAMTYYGRWTYKFEQASRLGAKGVLIIHHRKGATYGWDVVRNSWSREEFFLPSAVPNNFFQGWISGRVANEVLAAAGLDRRDLHKRAETASFKPIPTGIKVAARHKPAFRNASAENVGAILRGRHPDRKERFVVISAHFDHLGKDPTKKGDAIFNGAVDNCSASAAMLAIARRLKDREKELPFDVIFLAATAEEVGLLGSRYFATHLPVDKNQVWANINLELANVWGETEDVYAIGSRESDLDVLCRQAAESIGLRYTAERSREDGFFYRSDQLSFARVGIPGVWLHEGVVARGSDPQRVVRAGRNYKAKTYHTVADEVQSDWDLRGLAQLAHWAEALAFEIGTSKQRPRFLPTSAFARK